jgi:hypothetical protein
MAGPLNIFQIVYTPVNAAPGDERDICHNQWTRAMCVKPLFCRSVLTWL